MTIFRILIMKENRFIFDYRDGTQRHLGFKSCFAIHMCYNEKKKHMGTSHNITLWAEYQICGISLLPNYLNF